MIELQPTDYPQAARQIPEFPSLDSLKSSTLEGKQAGRVFADEAGNAVVWHISGFCFVHLDDSGRVPPELPALLRRLRGECKWVGVLLPSALDHTVAERLMPQGYDERTRFSFTFHGERFAGPKAAPAGFELRAIDSTLPAALSIRDEEWCFAHWTDFAEFSAHGFGYCLLADASQTDSAPTTPTVAAHGKVELAVATEEHFRRRGLATVVSAAAVDHCLRRGLLPEWSCHADNEPSIRLAEKLGFVRGEKYPVFVPEP